ncbi:MAG: tripartite tricarboxylate transporter substrate binding protein [Betaproteobacteria bacterium]|nr:tripartite tricarboxylate transporter substrate binding protein [Betaproteobacteria bacterium]
MPMIRRLAFLLLTVLLLPAQAQDWPTRPLRFVVTFPPGGTSDIVARLVSERLASRLGQPVVVENRPGVAGILATDLAARAAPDGYTMVLTSIAPIAFAPATPRKLEYDPLKDFSHLAIMAATPLVFIVSNEQAARSVADVIAAARAAPGKLNFSSSGNATPSHVMLERFKAATGAQITHVPYKGSAPALTDILAGRIDGTIDTMPALISQIRAGKVRALAVSGPRRMPQLPDVPTLAESGHADLVATSWFGVAVPAATPAAIVQRLNREIYAVLELPEVKSRFDELSLAPVPMSAAETQRYIQSEIERWRSVVQATGISFQ